MLLTITYEGQNTQELGYLLHKHPDRAQQFALSYGKAYVFYPEVSDARTTAALLLDIDPLDLARGKVGTKDGGLFDYVNDRPYAATSFMSTAISRVFSTAMSGRCDKRQALADSPLSLTARLFALKDNGDEGLAEALFAPLGYAVTAKRVLLDDKFPEWGNSPYIDLTISGTVKLSELLNHLYVLIPVFDRQKHYYISESEIQKLLDHGAGWLANHPAKERIARRYFSRKKSYAQKALDILLANENIAPEADAADENNENSENSENNGSSPDEIETENINLENGSAETTAAATELESKRTPLNTQRLLAVKKAVLKSGAASVIDLGCGEGRLTSMLLREPQIRKITACDVAVGVLEKAARKLHIDRQPAALKDKLTLMQASLTYRDRRFEGYDCACVVEVIEHIDPMRLSAFERSVFEFAAPGTVVLTTPNREYNAKYENMRDNALRHGDHRFEWTRDEFKQWTDYICKKFGYECVISGIGEADAELGAPTQMGVFRRKCLK